MTKVETSKTLKAFSDEKLSDELARRRKKKLGKVLGYRAILPGDEYDYGCIDTYIIGTMRNGIPNIDKKTAEQMAENSVKNHGHGYIEVVYENNLKWTGGKVH